MSITSLAGVVLGGAQGAERCAGYGMAWHQLGSRPRPDAFLTLDPTQRPSAPPRRST